MTQADVDQAMERVREARENGSPGGSLVELLLRERSISPDDALALRAEYDKKSRSTRVKVSDADNGGGGGSNTATASGIRPRPKGHSSRRIAVEALDALASESAHGNLKAPVRQSEVRAPNTASQQIMAVFSDKPSETRLAKKAPPDPLIGRTLGGCEILHKLGEGGMGTVYQARHIGLDKFVAIKVLPPDIKDSEVRIERFKREAKSAAQIEHPNIVQIHNVGEEEGVHFIIMQYIQGEDLRHRLRREGPMDPREMLDVARQVAKGLSIAHDKGIVHRDIKPDNIMFDEAGNVKLTDFGLAKNTDRDTTTTRPGKAVGTPYYMSPEQCAGKECDPRSDIYSLGATMYHVITGKRPFKGDTPVQTALMHLRQPLTPPQEVRHDVPKPIGELIERMMAKNPDARFQSCQELVIAMDQADEQMTGGSPLDMISQLVGGLGQSTVDHTGSGTQLDVNAPDEEITEPALPTAVSDSPLDGATEPGLLAVDPGSEGIDASGVLATDSEGEAQPGDESFKLPHWTLLLGGAVGLLLLGALVGLLFGGGDPEPDPNANGTGVEPLPNHPGNTGPRGEPDSNLEMRLARRAWATAEEELAGALSANDFMRAVAIVRAFMESPHGPRMAAEAETAMELVRDGTTAYCRKLLQTTIDDSNRAASARNANYLEAEQVIENGRKEIRTRLLQLFPEDEGIQRLLETLQKHEESITSDAERAMRRGIDYAKTMIENRDPPLYFAAEELLAKAVPTAMKRHQEVLKRELVHVQGLRDEAMRVRLAGGIQLAARMQELASEMARGFADLERDAERLPTLDEAIKKFEAEWITDPPDPDRALVRALALRVLADLRAVKAVFDSLVRRYRAGRTVPLLMDGEARPTDYRLVRATPNGILVKDDGTRDDRLILWEDLDEGWLGQQALEGNASYLHQFGPHTVELFYLAQSRQSSSARDALEAIIRENSGLAGTRFQDGVARESLLGIHRAAVLGYHALAAYMAGIADGSGDTRGFVNGARDIDRTNAQATLAHWLDKLHPARINQLSTERKLELVARAREELLKPVAADDPFVRFPLYAVMVARMHLPLAQAETERIAAQRILTPMDDLVTSALECLMSGNDDTWPGYTQRDEHMWRYYAGCWLRSHLSRYMAESKATVGDTTIALSYARRDALAENPADPEIWKLVLDLEKGG